MDRRCTDWVVRYRVPSTFPAGKILPLLNVYLLGDRFAGWDLSEEYNDGRTYDGDNGGEIAISLIRFARMFAMLLIPRSMAKSSGF